MNNKVREINSDALFHLVVRRWRLLALVPLLALSAAGLAWSVQPDRYKSRAKLLIQDQQTVNPFLKDLFEEWSAKQRMPLILSIFESHDTSERTLRILGRLHDKASPEEVNKAVVAFQHGFEVIGIGGELVLIKVEGETPLEAYEAATALIQTFTGQMLRPQKETLRASTEFFEDQLERLRGETADVEPSVAQLPEAQLVSPVAQLSIRRKLAEAEVRLASTEQKVVLSEAKLAAQLRVRSPRGSAGTRHLRKDLMDARSDLFDLEHRFEETHPELAVVKARVRSLEDAIRRERKKSSNISIKAIHSQPAVPGGQPESSTSELSRHENLVLELKEARAKVGLLRQRLLTEELAMFEEANQIWTVEKPVRPTRSLKRPLWFVLAGALFASLVLAFLAVAFFAAFDDALRGEKELAEALGAPSLGRMPRGEA